MVRRDQQLLESEADSPRIAIITEKQMMRGTVKVLDSRF